MDKNSVRKRHEKRQKKVKRTKWKKKNYQHEMNVERTTVWRIKNKAQEKIIKNLLGGNDNV